MNRNSNSTMMIPFTPTVKWLLITNVGVWFVFQVLWEGLAKLPFNQMFSLIPAKVLFEYHIWQLGTYMFLHSMQVTHILFNMLMLWFFGAELEQRWGSRSFLKYYLTCGVGAGALYTICIFLYALIVGGSPSLVIPVVGASGALFGLMLAYGIIFGERIVYFFMLFPMKAKYFVLIMGALEFVSMITSGVSGQGGEVAYLAHLGGIATGFIYLRLKAYKQQKQWLDKKKGASKLKLVVDNENPPDKNGPRYWN